LITLPHGGVHSNFNSMGSAVVRELIAQEYVIVAPEYRGSTGYGQQFYELIDYGGLESEDTYEARNFMVENCEYVDPERIGVMGWSHGGMHTLFNVFNHPEAYQAAHASVPVSDVIARMGYKSQDYRNLFEAKYHIGKSGNDNYAEYKRRSPAWAVPEYDSKVHPSIRSTRRRRAPTVSAGSTPGSRRAYEERYTSSLQSTSNPRALIQ